jgi:GNAT superfamily N-acetyltransferase
VKIDLSFVIKDTIGDIVSQTTLFDECAGCLYWQSLENWSDSERTNKSVFNLQKKEWLEEVNMSFGNCALCLSVDDIPVGYAQYAPPEYLPRIISYPVVPSPGAVLITCLYVYSKQHQRQGLGTVLLNAVIEDLEQRGHLVVETIARKGNAENPSGPVDFYLKNNFSIYKEDKEFPLMRFTL